MTRQHFEAITRCVHLVDNTNLASDHSDPAYDRIAKVSIFVTNTRIEVHWFMHGSDVLEVIPGAMVGRVICGMLAITIQQ